MSKNYFLQLFIAVDQLGNAILGGWADETLSSRAYRSREKPLWGFMEKCINIIFFSKNHCHRAYLEEIYRVQNFPLPQDRT